MVSRTELCSCIKVFDIQLTEGEHKYVLGFPVYDKVYVGRHLFPDDELFYQITGDLYAKLITLKKADDANLTDTCQKYLDKNVLGPIVDGSSKYVCIGRMKDLEGSEMSMACQSVVNHMREAEEDYQDAECNGEDS